MAASSPALPRTCTTPRSGSAATTCRLASSALPWRRTRCSRRSASRSCSTPTGPTPPRWPRSSRSNRPWATWVGSRSSSGPVGQRAAGLLAKEGAQVTITSRKPEQGDKARQFIDARFNVQVNAVAMSDPAKLPELVAGADVLLNSGPAGVQMVPRSAWSGNKTLKVAVDLNAVPPLGIEGVDVNDAGVKRDGVTVFGAFGVGNVKTKLHKACVAKLFTRNDLVLDAEAIAEVAREMVKQS